MLFGSFLRSNAPKAIEIQTEALRPFATAGQYQVFSRNDVVSLESVNVTVD